MSITAIILAAGKGTRMNSDLPKVLHEVCGRPMLAYVFDACLEAGCDRLIAVCGHQAEKVRAAFAGIDGRIAWVEQVPQLGTGHAVMVCKDEMAKLTGQVLVVAGDGPLLRGATLKKLLDTHARAQAVCTLATCILDDPGRYGRILRDEKNELVGIVEHLDTTEQQRKIREVNVSVYCFQAADLRWAVERITNKNAKGEYYLTDAITLLRAEGRKLTAAAAIPPEEVLSINTIDDLKAVEAIMAKRRAKRGGVLC